MSFRPVLTVLLLFSLSLCSWADVGLPNVFSDHMVLQRDTELPVWGTARPGESISVSLGDLASAQAAAGDDGTWSVRLPAQDAGGPHVLTVKASNTVTFKDVLIGEVWLCSGQSNMEWTVGSSANAAAEIQAGDFPQIRHLKVPRKSSSTPKKDQAGRWQVCSPDTVANFTATGYYFAKRLQQELDVPIGLLGSNWGGTRIEPWTPIEGFAKVPELQGILQDVEQRTPGHPTFQRLATSYLESVETWTAEAKRKIGAKQSLAPSPPYPQALVPFKSHQSPTMLYNAMIAPLIPYAIRGAIWYQGESNHTESDYTEKTIALVEGWRQVWQPEIPYYFVQIAPYHYGKEDKTVLAKFWEQQAAVETRLADSGMVVINDIGNVKDIHPRNKQDVGLRLANLALAKSYGKTGIAYSGPRYRSMRIEGDRIRVSFDHAEGVASRDGKPLSHFEIIGPDSKGWQPAKATIEGSDVILQATSVAAPVALRFAWDKLAEPNLINAAGLSTGAFRAGALPAPKSILEQIGVAADYELLYDLDLAMLSDTPRYTSDRSAELSGGIARIGYLLELGKADQVQWVYVSMNAFTQKLAQLALPTSVNRNVFQQAVSGLRVYSSIPSVAGAGKGDIGNIEFWPHNYTPANAGKVGGANAGSYDVGDQRAEPVNGYGCLQIHATGSKTTLLAINNRRAGAQADLGIGNSPGQHTDWTFTKSGKGYDYKRLRIFVQLK